MAVKRVEGFRTRPIRERAPYLWLDATFHELRQGGRVISLANVVAVGVNTGWRQVLGTDVGEDEASWTRFLRSLVRRGLEGVVLHLRVDGSDTRAGKRCPKELRSDSRR